MSCSPLKCPSLEGFNALLWFSESAMILYHSLPNTLWEGDTQNLPPNIFSADYARSCGTNSCIYFTSDAWEKFQPTSPSPQEMNHDGRKYTIISTEVQWSFQGEGNHDVNDKILIEIHSVHPGWPLQVPSVNDDHLITLLRGILGTCTLWEGSKLDAPFKMPDKWLNNCCCFGVGVRCDFQFRRGTSSQFPISCSRLRTKPM